MKNILNFVIIISFCANVYSQEKIDGIGIFTIGKTKTKTIDKILKEYNTELDSYNSNSESKWLKYIRGYKVAEFFPSLSDSNNNPLRTSYCPDLRVFYINKYDIAGITLSNIHLRFYKNTLIEFYCDYNEELKKALISKYGKPENLAKWNELSLFNKIDSLDFSSQFWKNKTICASFNFEYDSSKVINSYFVIRDFLYDNIINDCQYQRKKEYLENEVKRLEDIEKMKNNEIIDEL